MSAGMGNAARWRLAVDIGPVQPQPAGVGTYAASLAAALAPRLAGRLALIGARPHAAKADALEGVPRQANNARNYYAWLQLAADRQARHAGAALVHYTNAAAPLISRLPYVLTVHDLSLMAVPGTHPLARRATIPLSLLAMARAQAIIVPSDWTRRELLRLRVPDRRVTVIGHAAAPAPATSADDARDTLGSLGLDEGGYLLVVGTIEPRKNTVRLIEAFESLLAERPHLRLVLAGAPGWRYAPILRRAEQSPARERIIFAGYQTPAALAALTRASGACAYISIYEGFGMPIFDAMSLSAAVVTSDRTAMPATAGGAAVLVDPFDVADITRGLARALDEREDLIARGLRRTAARTWADVGAEHLEVYDWVVARHAAGTRF